MLNLSCLTGTLKSEVMISVADSATITLKDCHIREKTFQYPVITCLGSAEIITSGTSILGGIPGPYFKRLLIPALATIKYNKCWN